MAKKLPGLMFFPDDYLADEKLSLCSLSAQGLWMRLLCLMHKNDRRGYLQQANGQPLSHEQIARNAGCSSEEVAHLMRELESSGVTSATEHGVIYNRRMVREGEISRKRSAAGKKGGEKSTLTRQLLLEQNASKPQANGQANAGMECVLEDNSSNNKKPRIGGGVGEGRVLLEQNASKQIPPSDFDPLSGWPVAKGIVAHFQKTTGNAHAAGNREINAVLGLLERGVASADELKRRADRYVASERSKGQTDARYWVGAFRFYGEGVWEQYEQDRPAREPPVYPRIGPFEDEADPMAIAKAREARNARKLAEQKQGAQNGQAVG